jgi:2-succinyl-6-hydroxy-2,4-cyclohexadiene-1-carboxylate synthase
MSATLVYAIHGFLGESADWSHVKAGLEKNSEGSVNFITEDLFGKDESGLLDFNKQTDSIINKIKSFDRFNGKKILLGYSLGGRIGLHVLKKNPELFDHYVFLSTNPGLKTPEERKVRILHDQSWSEKISLENWDNFIKEWNSQSVFAGSADETKRDPSRYDLLKLKEAMVKWSLGQQSDFSDTIQMYDSKILWMVGDRDQKYCEIAESFKKSGVVQNYIKASSGHRIWLDNPQAVVDEVSKLI